MESHRKGDFTEAVVIAELKRREISVSTPFGDNERYDLLIESPDGKFHRTQVKTGWLSDGKIHFHGESQHTNSAGNVYKDYDGEVDFFIVYCHEIEELYLIENAAFDTAMSLRVQDPKQRDSSINWAENYEFDTKWPPESISPNAPTTRFRHDAVQAVINKLEAEDIHLAEPLGECDYDLLAQRPDAELSRLRAKPGWIVNGRIRYNPETYEPGIDYLCIVLLDSDDLYIVPDDDFNKTISLRVDPAKQDDSRINWAENYAWPEVWLDR